jgi:photosynthetic reaction center cytochrome c subunit
MRLIRKATVPEIYENVQVLGDPQRGQFNLFMASITEWVSPEQGCNYCHNEENLADDEVYTKVVARRMIQMTQTSMWTGSRMSPRPVSPVTPATVASRCRPMSGPRNLGPGKRAGRWAGATARMLLATGRQHLASDQRAGELSARRQADPGAFAHGSAQWRKPDHHQGDRGNLGLMMHMSESLGANCMTCHNSRAFNDWDQSPPQRVTAWHGIRMAREINQTYMTGLAPVFPDNRKGPEGDVLKVSCATCHNGVQKPLYGVSMLKEFVDSLGTRTNTDVPDYTTYKPGETQVMGRRTRLRSNPCRHRHRSNGSGLRRLSPAASRAFPQQGLRTKGRRSQRISGSSVFSREKDSA